MPGPKQYGPILVGAVAGDVGAGEGDGAVHPRENTVSHPGAVERRGDLRNMAKWTGVTRDQTRVHVLLRYIVILALKAFF